MKLLIATRNAHKLQEITALFAGHGLTIVSALDYPDIPDVEEDGKTLEANACKKAETLCQATGLPALADDTGLEVAALGGAPGVYSARYAGVPPDYAANNRKLLAELTGHRDRSARFRCVIALARPGQPTEWVEGICAGAIALAPRGEQGFGYDPLFIPNGQPSTFAELSEAEKNRISHRGLALAAAQTKWSDWLHD